MKNKKTILYHIVNKVHFKNFLMLSRKMKNINFIILYEKHKEIKSLNIDKLVSLNKNRFKFIELNLDIFDELKKIQNIKLVFISIAQPRLNSLNIILWSLINNIPIVSIMETNQYFLHSGKINNYILPVNKLFVNSSYDKKFLSKIDYNTKNIINFGWPFFDYEIQNINLYKRYNANKNKKNLLLIFDASKKHNPKNQYFFKDIIRTINLFKLRFSNHYNIFIKFHPLDENTFKFNLYSNITRKIYIIKDIDIQKLLSSFDLTVSTGLSQSVIELILNQNPFFIFILNKNTHPINNYFKKIILTKNDLSDKKINNAVKQSLLYRLNKNCVYLNPNNSMTKIVKEINSILGGNKKFIDETYLKEIVIWTLYFINNIKKSYHNNEENNNYLSLYTMLVKKLLERLKNSKTNNSLNKIFNQKETEQDYQNIYKWCHKKLILHPFNSIYIAYLIKNRTFEAKYLQIFFKKKPIDIHSERIFFDNVINIYKYLKIYDKNTFNYFNNFFHKKYNLKINKSLFFGRINIDYIK